MTDQPSLFSDPPAPKRDFTAGIRARQRDAAKPQPAPTAKESKAAIVLAEICLHSGSDRQIHERLTAKGFKEAGERENVRKRRRELELRGQVRFSGEYVTNDAGNEERVYEATYAGRLYAGFEDEAAA